MARATAKTSSHELTWSMPYRSSQATVEFHGDRPCAQMPKENTSQLEKMKDVLRSLCNRPSSGRTTALGRRVEKPGEGNPGGPSGQRDGAKHDERHTNK
jgi:hypothetical protein